MRSRQASFMNGKLKASTVVKQKAEFPWETTDRKEGNVAPHFVVQTQICKFVVQNVYYA